MSVTVSYLKEFSPVQLNGTKLKFHDNAEHVDTVRSVVGNLPNIVARLTAHKNAVSGVLHIGVARQHRGNPPASIRVEQVFGFPVLLSGLESLVLTKIGMEVVNTHHQKTTTPSTVLSKYPALSPLFPCRVPTRQSFDSPETIIATLNDK